VETRNGPCPCGDGPNSVRFIILVDDAGGIPLPGFLHRRHLAAGGLIRGAPKRVGSQDCLHDGVEGSHVSDRGSECPDGRLDIGLLDEISHVDTPVYGFPGISGRREYIKKKGVYGRDCIKRSECRFIQYSMRNSDSERKKRRFGVQIFYGISLSVSLVHTYMTPC